jgi:mRNA interferase RelE/StbE
MASYKLAWKRSAEKELRRLPKETIGPIVQIGESLRDNPFPKGVRKLAGADRLFRLRSGDYRLIYSVEPAERVVEILRVRHRSEAYR